MRTLFLAMGCVLAMAAAEPAFVGSRVCGGCHPAEYRKQSASEHAAALRRAGDHPLFASFPEKHVAYRPPDYRLTWLRQERGMEARVWDGAKELRLPVEWAFGAGQQAVTFVSRVDDERYVEHHLSYYAGSGSLAATPGHRSVRPGSLNEAFGVLYRIFAEDSAIMRCFACHSTGPLQLTDTLELQPSEPGVRCEGCHGPGERHVAAKSRAGIFNAASLNNSAMNTFCGNCHRPPASDPTAIDWSDPWNVRHQPVYLSRSACMESGLLRCTTCHDPHSALDRSAASYNQRCSSCHETAPASCKTDCVGCHMPKVRPQPNLAFTNHWIGVFDGADSLRPQRQRR